MSSDPIYHHLLPKHWSPILYTITLHNFVVPTRSFWKRMWFTVSHIV